MNGINRTRSLAEFARSIFLPFLTVALTTFGARAQAPDWKVDPAAFESSMTIVGTVYVGGNQSSGSGDVLAAFVGNEVRGVAHPLLAGEQLFFMVIYANAEADTLRFRMYDGIGDQIVDLRETLIFTPDGTAGSPSAPLVFNEERAAGANMPDWTVTPSQFESSMGIVGTVATDETPSIEDRLAVFVNGEIRGVNQPVLIGGAALFFLTVYGDTPGDTLSFRLYDADDDAISGLREKVPFEVDGIVGTVAQPMQLTEHSGAGSNIPDWSVNPAAYENTMSIVAALFTDGARSSRAGDMVAAFSGPDVRGVGTAQNVASQTLFFLTVYGRSSEPLTFRAYNSGADEVQDLEQEISFVPDAILGSVSQPLVVSTPYESGSGLNRPDWTAVPARYSLSMNVIGVLSLEGATSGNDSDMIGAYVGEEIRGVASPILVGGQSLFFLTIYANASGEPITFRAYDASRDRVRGVGDPITFVPDAITGSIDRPYVWSDAAGAQRPTWEPDSTAFGSAMTVIATLLINGEPSTHPENLISARASDVVRGSAGPTQIDGQTLFAMRVFADNDGEVLSVEAYDG
ncbi:MAG: hypothetical protein KJO98_09840, partial [Rhodothermia bacterium]|nr:hypothetical protein [Rhodothermia bacterium]